MGAATREAVAPKPWERRDVVVGRSVKRASPGRGDGHALPRGLFRNTVATHGAGHRHEPNAERSPIHMPIWIYGIQ